MNRNNNHIESNEFIQYIEKFFQRMGVKIVYAALLLFYAYNSKETPGWAKKVIIGALAYFVSPIDGIPDLSPFLGFTDDMGILSYGIVMIACYINDDIRSKAKTQLHKIFKKVDEAALLQVDKML